MRTTKPFDGFDEMRLGREIERERSDRSFDLKGSKLSYSQPSFFDPSLKLNQQF